MRFSPDKTDRRFFHHHGFVEFEDFLSPPQRAILESATQLAQLELVRTKPNPDTMVIAGFNLWQRYPSLKNLALNRSIGGLVKEVFDETSLRLAFDQYIEADTQGKIPQGNFSIAPLLGFLVIRLADRGDDATASLTIDPNEPGMVPSAPHRVRFVRGKESWPTQLDPHIRLWILAFCPTKGCFVNNAEDPCSSLWKNYGYVVGESLRDRYNPPIG